MARLIGVDLPRNKHPEAALTYTFRISCIHIVETLAAVDVSGDLRVHQLTNEQLVALRNHIGSNYEIEGDLRCTVVADIRHKVEIGNYQGHRHYSGLPVRGQHTHTNTRTREDKKKAVTGRKKAH